MGRADFLKLGDWNAICDYCGKKYKASELRQTWQGFMACERDWEPRQPQDFAHGIPDDMTPPWQRPVVTPNFAATSFVQLQATSALVAANSTVYQSNDTSDPVEGNVDYTMTIAGHIKTFSVSAVEPPGRGNTYTYTIRKNGVSISSLVIVLSGGSAALASITANVAIAIGDTIDVKIVTSASAVATYHTTSILVA